MILCIYLNDGFIIKNNYKLFRSYAFRINVFLYNLKIFSFVHVFQNVCDTFVFYAIQFLP